MPTKHTIETMRAELELEQDPAKRRASRCALAMLAGYPPPVVPTREEILARGYAESAVEPIIAEQKLLVAEWGRQKAEEAAQVQPPDKKPAGWNRDGGNV